MRRYEADQLQNNESLMQIIKKNTVFLKVNKKYIINKFS